ncbi:abortive infection family protein [Xanthobacter oligotrophicus]|uniref:Abortive infection family protein n=1 Tax=Xanthobacter oligotrophicus TaxID=2607286 RepID=A0ABW6ZUP0_9HYPH
MPFEDELPADLAERARMMEGILIACATGGSQDGQLYEHMRREFMQDATLKELLPGFVRTYRTLDAFWPYIKEQAGSYAGRRQFIRGEFTPLIDRLESRHRAPGDDSVSDALRTFDAEGVHAIWDKAVSRRASDPEGAITVARTLLETVCKRILDDCAASYSDKDDLPKLYSTAAKALNLAPDQHSEEPIKAILGGAMGLVNGIGTLRNRLSDAHGRGGPLPVKPSPRHASLAVNTAGAIAAFMVETHLERRSPRKRPWQDK